MLRDLNFETGAKLTGEISTWEKIANLPILQSSDTERDDWFSREVGAVITDISKHNGVINWRRMWEQADGVIARLGYGSVRDPKFNNSTVPGFKSSAAENKYRGLYHYMNTGVSVSNQINLILSAIDDLDGNIQSFWTDVERGYNEPTSSAFFANPLKIMRAVRQEYPHITVGFYTNKASYNILNGLGNVHGWLDEFLFWYAWYPYGFTKYPSPPRGVSLGDIYLWQYSADGNGQGGNYGAQAPDMDINVSRDSAKELLSEYFDYEQEESPVTDQLKAQIMNEAKMYEAAIDDTHEAIERNMNALRTIASQHTENIEAMLGQMNAPTVEPLYSGTVIVPELNVRSGPGTHNFKVDKLYEDQIVTIWEEVQGSQYKWGKISETEDLWVAVLYIA